METFDTLFAVAAAVASLVAVARLSRPSAVGGQTRREEGEAGDVPLEVTGGELDCPVWLFGTEGAERWVFPPRRPGGIPVTIVDLSDPWADGGGGEERDAVIDGGSLVIAELLWALGDLQVSDMALLALSRRRVFTSTAESVSFEDVAPVLEGEDRSRTAVAWGVAVGPDDARVRLGLRLPDSAVDLEIEGTIPEVAARMLGVLEEEGLLTALDPPPWYRAPAEVDLPLYARLLDNLHLQIVADETNELTRPLPAETHREYVERARDASSGRPEEGAQWSTIAAITALHAHRAGALSDVQRLRAVADVLEADDDHPLARLAPHLLAALGEGHRARRAWRELRETADGAFAEWLDAIEPDVGGAGG